MAGCACRFHRQISSVSCLECPAPSPHRPALVIRPMRHADLPLVAALHTRRLPHGFFAALGIGFLQRYHESFLASPYALAHVATEDEQLFGFVTGTHHHAGHYRWVIRHRGIRLATAGIAALIRRPRLWLPFVRQRLRRYVRGLGRQLRRQTTVGPRRRGAPPRNERTDIDLGVLTHLAVAISTQGRGVGRQLAAAFLQGCTAAGTSEIRLVTKAAGGARGFYRHLGWTELRERPASAGSLVVEFRYNLSEDRPA